MAVLLGQVGTALPSGALWPRLTDGFAETWSQISAEPSVGTAIISAGHEAFIAKTFQVHSLPRPGDVVTDDVVIQAGYGDFSPEERAKPNPLIMGLTFQRWRQARQILISEVSGSNILYVGDDPYKDGRLASNSRVGFELLVPTPQESRRTWKKVVAWALQDQALSSEGYSDVRS